MRASLTGLVTPLFALAAILSVSCNETSGPSEGAVRVTVTTTGVDLDADGYAVTVAGTRRLIGNNESVLLTGVPLGEYLAVLAGVDPNCSVAGQSTPVTVVAVRPASVAFAVTCVLRTGSVRVITATAGADLDADGYSLALDRGAEQPIGTSGTLTIAGVPGGDHTLALNGVAGNCSVDGQNPRSLVVPFGGSTVNVSFTVRCLASGKLQVTAATSGTDLDPNGYGVSAARAGSRTTQDLLANGSVTFSLLVDGNYSVLLSGVAANCDITGGNPRTASVAAGATTSMTFDVVCAPLTRLAFAKTTNSNTDIWTINSNGTGATPLTTNASEDAAPAWSPDGSKIAFRSNRDGNAEIYVMNADGSGVTRLRQSIAGRPSWSPDGRSIAFASRRDGAGEIYVMNADGSGLVQLTSNDKEDSQPAWSPDGQRIAFASNRDGNFEIYVMSVDGSGVKRLTSNTVGDTGPAWSPDGSRLAFSRFAFCGYNGCESDIYLMNADGSAQTELASGLGERTEPTWSPDGRKIAFSLTACDYYCYDVVLSVMVVTTDGTNLAELTSGSVFNPSWRP
jgi:WD40 repeat protein